MQLKAVDYESENIIETNNLKYYGNVTTAESSSCKIRLSNIRSDEKKLDPKIILGSFD